MVKDAGKEEVLDFDEEYEDVEKVGMTFKLGGQVWHTKAIAPVAAFRDKTEGLDAAVNFLALTLVAGEQEAFLEMIDDPESGISAYQLDQVAAKVIERTSGRPTGRRGSSGTGRAPMKRSLKGA